MIRSFLVSEKPICLDLSTLVLRVVLGASMLFGHGLAKLQNFSDLKSQFPDPIGVGASGSLMLAIFAEFFCSALLVVGLLSRFASLALVITMGIAVFVVTSEAPWAERELGALYLAGFTATLFLGSGKYSLDRLLFK